MTGAMDVEAELRTAPAIAQLVRYNFPEPPSSKLREDTYRIELCLTSRQASARACFRDFWTSHRFERIGDMFLVPPNMDVLARSDEAGSMTSLICRLQARSILSHFDTLPELSDKHLTGCLDIRNDKIRALMLRLAEEVRDPGFASEMLVELTAELLSIELFRHGLELEERHTQGGLASWQLKLIDERLQEVGEAPSLAELAALCRLSVRQLTRGFRASKSCSLGAYVAEQRIKHAKALLAEGQSVALIAPALGFASSSGFCFAFRRATGQTPGQFRAALLRQ